jgi:hypothetical protein
VADCTNNERPLYLVEFVAVPLKAVAETVPIKVGLDPTETDEPSRDSGALKV